MIDWLHSTEGQRKELYRAYRRLMVDEGLGWAYLFDAAFGHVRKVGSGYEDNFRAGKIDRGIAKLLYGWLRAEHTLYANELDVLLETGDARPGALWEDFLHEQGRYEGLAAALVPEPSIGLVRVARPEPLAVPVIPLRSDFCFQFTPPFAGRLIAFQSFEGNWFPMPLTDEQWSDDIIIGMNTLPRGILDGSSLPFVEEVHEGRHGFAFLVGDPGLIDGIIALVPRGHGPINKWILDQIAETLKKREEGWSLHRINLLFRG
jgi:hypothetical protein